MSSTPSRRPLWNRHAAGSPSCLQSLKQHWVPRSISLEAMMSAASLVGITKSGKFSILTAIGRVSRTEPE
jgi:hypothetical protein